jgi:hypothetical protein
VKARIIFPARVFPPRFTLARGRAVCDDQTGLIASGSLSLLGLLNSRLAAFVFCSLAKECGHVSDEWSGRILGQFPVCTPDLDDPSDKARHDRLETLVKETLDLNRHRGHAATDREKQLIEREIESTDKQIDSLVYGIYGLSVDEILVVEDALTTIKSPS